MTTPHAYLSATAVLARFRDGSLTPTAYAAELIAHINATEGTINATTGERLGIDEALAEAERRYADGTARPLEGLPVVLKEEQPIQGLPETNGSPLFKDNIAEVTHPIITRIVEAGGIPLIRATTPEFCIAGYTRGKLWGITRNPWNPEFAVGGSSGGTGASLAAGYAPLGTGSDIGGSTRIPASFNGVVGYKPPYGRNPALAPSNLDRYCTDGPMARTVADVALLQNVISGQHPDDPVSLPSAPTIVPNADLTGKRIALALTLGDYGVQDDVRDAVAASRAWLEAAGATVTQITVPIDHEFVMQTAWTHFGTIFVPWIAEITEMGVMDQLEPYTRQAMELATKYINQYGVLGGIEREVQVHETIATVFAEYDALVCPVAGIPAFRADDYYLDGITVNGVENECHITAAMTTPFNIANRNPVLAVPVGRSADDVPIGVQVVGAPYAEQIVFDVGAAIEAGRGDWYQEDAHRPAYGLRTA
ncbi:amidase [Microterricola viridarii]|uniref:Aspartyl-tRNA(Asn)/glutamyl-tRNA(Gln) amidotransferase subunit A n=1 Tax=Microterricola viridarii TaxID=412690 RepID=A0A1H1UPH1_9MICO|nr:amidase [Microterricola viridarii]SDS74180.1 aspartyl-tRNA(Asn)/glutamyl-tRNA(Gln) amidotransferase subunit A [Microterricola viridarii]